MGMLYSVGNKFTNLNVPQQWSIQGHNTLLKQSLIVRKVHTQLNVEVNLCPPTNKCIQRITAMHLSGVQCTSSSLSWESEQALVCYMFRSDRAHLCLIFPCHLLSESKQPHVARCCPNNECAHNPICK